jgi:hypothetical protein
MASLASICLYAASAGVASHLGYFIHGEHHIQPPAIAGVFLLALVIMPGLQVRFLGEGILVSAFRIAAILSSYAISLWTSMITYRLFFHRLRSFPGPVGAKISKIWHSYHSFPGLKSFRVLEGLHAKYGDIVRTGTIAVAMSNRIFSER